MASSFRFGRRLGKAVRATTVLPEQKIRSAFGDPPAPARASARGAGPGSSESPSLEGEPPVLPSTPAEPDSSNAAADRSPKDEHLAGGLKQLLQESDALETLLRDSVEGRPAQASNGSRRFQLGPWQSSHRRLWLAAGAALVAAGLVVNVVALLHVTDSSSENAQVVAGANAPEINAAAAWVGRELARDAKIITDPVMRAALTADRFVHIQTSAATPAGRARAQDVPTFDYVVSTAALRATARSGDPVDRALNSSLPIAVFGSGAHQVVVRQVSTMSAADIASRRTADRQTRRNAERQLLANPAIQARGAARTALQAGELDLRAATVLALMANSSHVNIVSVNTDEPEQAAGLPARTVDVRTNAAPAVQAMLSNLPSSYQPSTDTPLPNGTHRMVWPIDPEPPAVLN
jgi:hypothetical protein